MGRGAAARAVRKRAMRMATNFWPAHEPVADHDQKRLALGYLQDAWTEAQCDGIEGDCLAQRLYAGNRRVFGFAASNRGNCRLLNVVWRIEIWLAG